MAKDAIEEETYSLILSALKHPLRRKILRMLYDKPRSFSEILEVLSIDSGHLNYHIKSMGDIVTRTEDGKYTLSSVGLAAIELVGKVEEQDKSTEARKRTRRISKLAIVFSVILAIALLSATVYAVTFTTRYQGDLFKANLETETIHIAISSDQPFNYNITIDQLNADSGYGYSIGQKQTIVYIPLKRSDVSGWTRYFSSTELRLNGTYDISIEIYDPEENTIGYRNESGMAHDFLNIPLDFEFSRLGNYRLLIENLREGEFDGTLIPRGIYINFEKPLFNYGIIGLTILILYPILFYLTWKWGEKPR